MKNEGTGQDGKNRWSIDELSQKPSGECRILIVDENANRSQEMSQLLVEIGFRFSKIATGQAKLDKTLSEFSPDVLFIQYDLGSPEGGVKLARNIQQEQLTNASIVFVCDTYLPEIEELAADVNPVGYLADPINQVDLWSAILACYDDWTAQRKSA